MKIVGHEEMLNASGDPWSQQWRDGPHDGTVFTYVVGRGEDGRDYAAWICNAKPGYFKQIFVPFDFQSSKMFPPQP